LTISWEGREGKKRVFKKNAKKPQYVVETHKESSLAPKLKRWERSGKKTREERVIMVDKKKEVRRGRTPYPTPKGQVKIQKKKEQSSGNCEGRTRRNFAVG